jgi:hypothetical protein
VTAYRRTISVSGGEQRAEPDRDLGSVQGREQATAAFAWLKITTRRRAATAPPASAPARALSAAERAAWRMPPLALLKPVQWSPGTKLGILLLRGHLVISVILLVVKAIRLGAG